MVFLKQIASIGSSFAKYFRLPLAVLLCLGFIETIARNTTSPFCAVPTNLVVSNITNTSASISWASAGSSDYEYAVTQSSTPPVSGTVLNATTANVTGLLSSNNYYLHVRAKCGSEYSAWVTSDPFTTLDPPTNLIIWDPGGLSNFGPNPFNPTYVDNRITVGGVNRGAGVSTNITAAANAWGGHNWQGGATQDVTFAVVPKTGYKLSLSSLQLSYRISNTGPTTGTLSYSLDNGATYSAVTTFTFSSNTNNSGYTLPSVDLSSIPALQNIDPSTPVKFRLFPTGTDNAGTWYIYKQGLIIRGYLTSTISAPSVTLSGENPGCFTAAWSPVSGASKYIVSVFTQTSSLAKDSAFLFGYDFDPNLKSNLGLSGNYPSGNMNIPMATVGANGATFSSTTLSAYADGWNGGSGSKYWETYLKTTGYYNIRLNSTQRSSSTGPKDFKLQYKIGSSGTYIDVPSGSVTLADDYTTGVLKNISLPAACDNQPLVYLRWVLTSNMAVGSGMVQSGGTSNITDIKVYGFPGSNITYQTGYEKDTVSSAITSLPITSLSPNTTYYVTVRSIIGGVTSNASTTATITTTTSATADYRTKQSGLRSSASTWEYSPGCGQSWVAATAPPAATNNIIVQNGHTLTLDADVTVGNGKSLVVNNGGVLVTSTYTINGAGSFTLANGGTLSVGSASGITSSAASGNVQVTGTRSYSNAGNYIYASTVNQVTGDGLPSIVNGLSINNTGNAMIKLSSDLTIADLTILPTAILSLNDKALSLNGNLSGGGAISGSTASSLTFSGNGNSSLNLLQTTDGSSNVLANLTVNTGNVVLNSKLQVYKLLDISGGVFNVSGQSLVLKSIPAETARVAEIKGSLIGATNVTVERYIPALSSRRWRLVTSPVTGATVNTAWQEGSTWNGGPAEGSTGYGTLITGAQQGTAGNANSNGFDYWNAIANATASVRYYQGALNNANATWAPISKTTTAGFDNAEAYLLFVRGDRAVSSGNNAVATTLRATGTLRQGSTTIQMRGSNSQSHTLIGNPFASPLDFYSLYSDAFNSGKIKNQFWLFAADLGTLGAYKLVVDDGTNSGKYEALPEPFTPATGVGSTNTRLIHSGSGFFVEPLSTTNNSLMITETHKSAGTPSQNVFKTAGEAAKPRKLYINLSEDRTALGDTLLLDGAMMRFDITTADIRKAVNTGENLSIWKEGKDAMISTEDIPQAGDSLPLRLWNTTPQKKYLLQTKGVNISDMGLQAYLIDKYTGTETLVSSVGVVSTMVFSINNDIASKDPGRFVFVFKPNLTLPISVTSIRASLDANRTVQIEWNVTNGAGIKEYEIEKSTDGINFQQIATIKAKGESEPQVYTGKDLQPGQLNYYRIKMLSTVGEEKYSDVVKLMLKDEQENVVVYPNPSVGRSFGIQLINKPAGCYNLTLYNSAGQAIVQQSLVYTGGSATMIFSPMKKLAAGIYMLNLSNGSGKTDTKNLQVMP